MIWTGFILGIFGSLHCAGMCGPLVLAIPVVGTTRSSFIVGRLIYNSGRIFTYILIGALFGVAGEALSLAGFQQWLSLTVGVLILAGLLFTRLSVSGPATAIAGLVKRSFATLLRRRTYGGLFALGATNGLLPCGLVYIAAAAATATGRVESAAAYMLAFGLGTLPMMLLLPILGRNLSLRFNFQKLIPISVGLVAILLILRGLSLGIPYLSPLLTVSGAACH